MRIQEICYKNKNAPSEKDMHQAIKRRAPTYHTMGWNHFTRNRFLLRWEFKKYTSRYAMKIRMRLQKRIWIRPLKEEPLQMGSNPFWLSIHVCCFHYKYSAIKIQEVSHAIKNAPSVKIWTHCTLTSYPSLLPRSD